MRDHAEFLTEEQITAEVTEMVKNPEMTKKESDERYAYFTDPANAKEIEEQQARMELVIALYEARRAAGLTQKKLAEIIGKKQAYIAQIETGKKNITFSTLLEYAHACGKKVAVTLL